MRAKTRISIGCLSALLLAASAFAAAGDERLADAAKRRDVQSVRALLKQKVDVNATQPDGATALHWAAHWNDLELADLLLRAGANAKATNEYGVTPISLACTNANAPMVEALLKAGADPNGVMPSGETALMTAAHSGSVAVVKALLLRGAKVNVKERVKGQTPLMWAAAEGHADVVKTLIEGGAEIRARSDAGFTALLLAAREGRKEVTAVLLEAGVDVNEATPGGLNALVIATIRGRTDYGEFLLHEGADPNLGPGFNALHWASGEWPAELNGATTGILAQDTEWSPFGGLRGPAKLAFVKTLLAHGADPNMKAKSTPSLDAGGGAGNMAGATPFLMASKAGDAAVMRTLLEAGADPKVVTNQRATALMLASRLGGSTENWMTERDFLDAVKLIFELGGDVNASNNAGDTALHGAANCGCNSIVQFLLDKGANVNAKNRFGWSPLTLAEGVSSNAPSPATAELLRKVGAAPSPPDIERNAQKAARLLKP